MELKERILEAAIGAFNEKGIRFTMDDLARRLNISKKTIYTVFQDKETLSIEMIDYCFDRIKESEAEVLQNENLSLEEKLRNILGVLPEGYRDIDFRQLYVVKEKYPSYYKKIEERLENGWERTIDIIQQGIAEGVFRPVNIPIYKTMLEATLEQFFQRDVLIQNGISYKEALDEVVNILVEGVIKR